jgi:hypothetical protein
MSRKRASLAWFRRKLRRAGQCLCYITPERYWFTHYGSVEPGSQMEKNYGCPVHGAHNTRGIKL